MIIDNLIENFDDEYKEECTLHSDLSNKVFELEEQLYEAIKESYQRYYGEIFSSIDIDISEEIEARHGSLVNNKLV